MFKKVFSFSFSFLLFLLFAGWCVCGTSIAIVVIGRPVVIGVVIAPVTVGVYTKQTKGKKISTNEAKLVLSSEHTTTTTTTTTTQNVTSKRTTRPGNKQKTEETYNGTKSLR